MKSSLGAIAWVVGSLFGAPTARAEDPSIAATERSGLVTSVIGRLREYYVFPELGVEMGEVLRAHAERGEYATITGGAALAERLTGDLRAVSHDGHVRVGYHIEGARTEPVVPSREDMERMRERAAQHNFGFRKAECLDGNIGYIDFRGFWMPYLAAPTARAAMAFVASADALIVDLRHNRGGEPDMVAYLASFLFDERTHLDDIYVREGDRLEQYWTSHIAGPTFGGSKPLYLLISRTTFSAAEDFAYALKNLKRATLVGETTGGGAHPTRRFAVTEHFSLDVPFARSISPITQADWEGKGVSPDISVPAEKALEAAHRVALRQIAASKRERAVRRARSRRPARALATGSRQ